MISLKEFANALEALGKDWERSRVNLAIESSLDATDDIVERVREQRKNDRGDSFGQYSKKPTLVGRSSFRNKGAADKAFAEITEYRVISTSSGNKTLGVLDGGYQRIRELENLGSNPDIGFFRSNIMLNSTKPVIESVDANKVVVRIKPNRPDREEIMGHLENRFGKIIQLSESEEARILENYQNKISELINRHI